MVADHMEFHGMDVEFYLPDLQELTWMVSILQDNTEFTPIRGVKHFKMSPCSLPSCL